MPDFGVDHEQEIRELAYSLWQQAGSPEGDADRFWHEALQRFGQDLPQEEQPADVSVKPSKKPAG